MRLLFLLATMLVALPAEAMMFGTRYPAGSITSPPQAEAALKDADAEMTRIQQEAKSRDAACFRTFLVNACRDDARRAKQLAEREVRRVQLEARELKRRVEAEAVAKRRAEEAETRAAEDADRVRKQEAARADQAAREAKLKQRDGAAPASGSSTAATPGDTQKKEVKVAPSNTAQPSRAPPRDPLTAAERAENARKFEQKQAEAAERAREQQAQREKNEQRRAEKRKQLERREAEREALRQKAAQLPK